MVMEPTDNESNEKDPPIVEILEDGSCEKK